MVRRLWRRLLILAAVVSLPPLWGVAVEPALLRETLLERRVGEWPAGQLPIRVAFLTDLHVGAPHMGLARLEAIVDRVTEARPDLVLLGGDYVVQGVVGGRFVPPEDIARVLGRLRAPLGVIAVLGNHDWWLDGQRVRRALQANGIRVLENEAVPAGPLWVSGLADDTTRRPDAAAALAPVPHQAPVLMLMHDPANFFDMPRPVTLMLAGHTHGGQVRLPGLGALLVPGRAPRRHAYGLIEEWGQAMYVSAGLGTSILPVRFMAPPEIVLLTLRPAG